MSTQSEEIAAKISLDSTAFTRGIRGVVAETKTALGGLTGSFAGLLSGAGLAGIVGTLADMAKRVKLVSEVTGASTDFVQGFERALKKMGFAAEEADRVLEKFTEKVGDARQGGATKQVFDDLNLSLTNADKTFKSTQQLIGELADKFKAITDPALKAKLSVELFGKSGVEMGVLLSKGSTELNKLIDGFDKLSGGTIEQLIQARSAIKGVFESITIFVGKGVESIGNFFFILGSFVERYRQVLNGNLAPGETGFQHMRGVFKDFAEEQKRLADIGKQSAGALAVEHKTRKDILAIEQTKLKVQEAYLELANRDNAIAEAKRGRVKFTLEELAGSGVNFTGRLGREKIVAKRIQDIEANALALRNRGFFDQALEKFSLAEQLRSGLTNVVDKDRFPFQSLEESALKQAATLAEILRKSNEEGINILPANGR